MSALLALNYPLSPKALIDTFLPDLNRYQSSRLLR